VDWASALSATFRLGVCLFAVSLLSTVIFLRAVRADVERLLWESGASLTEHPDADLGIRRRLELNGALISFGTQTVEASLASTLDHYQSLCESRDAQLDEALTNLLGAHSAAPQTHSRLRAVTTTTARNAEAGYVACLDLGPQPRDLYALANGFARFAATGNLREAGVLRYVFARRISADSGPRTLVLTISAESDLNLRQMIPEGDSDAAGRDLAGVPRPLKSQRLLSAWEVDQPSGLALYRVSATAPAQLESFYRKELSQLGWHIIESNLGEAIEIDGIRMLSAERHGRVITVLSRPDEQGQVLLMILASEPTR
jgi:hypothetical protein